VILNSIVAAGDQATLSVLSFVISIILIKYVPKVEYGYYSIGFAISLFVSSIQQAIVNTPLAVLLIEKKGNANVEYAGSLCYGQFLVIIPAVCLGLAGVLLLSFWSFDSAQTWVAASVCFFVIGLLLREFLRAYLFAEEKPLQVLKIDTVYIALLLIGFVLAYLFYKLNVPSVFVLMGTSGLIVGLIFSRGRGWHFNRERIRESYRENWKYGRWALVGGLVTYIQSYSYLYLLGALMGSVAVAEVSAARLLITPLILFRAGWGRIVTPRGSKFREKNQLERFFKEQVIVTIVYVLVVALYALLLLSLSGLLQNLIFTQKYVDSFKYFPYWVAINAIGFAAINAGYGLEVTKNFKIMSKLNFVTMVVTLACAYLLINAYGIMGGLMALIIGASLSAAILWLYFFKSVFLNKSIHLSVRPNQILQATTLGKGQKSS
jgi:O-antigen/teichoic acid export membrane protein